jgi:predicted ester cyclase
MPEATTEQRYLGYLTCLNQRRFDDLAEFVHDPVTHNDRVLDVAEFADLLRRDVTQIPDLHYDVEQLVVSGDDVACRIRFDCTPAIDFRGIPCAGRRVSFAEHVFYRLRDGRIATIWSLIDLDAIRDHLHR